MLVLKNRQLCLVLFQQAVEKEYICGIHFDKRLGGLDIAPFLNDTVKGFTEVEQLGRKSQTRLGNGFGISGKGFPDIS